MTEERGARLTEISTRLEEAARRMRGGDVGGDEAARLAGECAELAAEAAAELDRLSRASPQEAAPGQEELL